MKRKVAPGWLRAEQREAMATRQRYTHPKEGEEMATKGTDLAKPGSTELARPTWEASQAIKAMFEQAGESVIGGPEIAAALAERTLLTETDEETWAQRSEGLPSTKDYQGRSFTLLGFRWAVSTFTADDENPDRFPYYQILEAVDERTGEKLEIASGGLNAMTKLFRHWQRNRPFPIRVKVVGIPVRKGVMIDLEFLGFGEVG